MQMQKQAAIPLGMTLGDDGMGKPAPLKAKGAAPTAKTLADVKCMVNKKSQALGITVGAVNGDGRKHIGESLSGKLCGSFACVG
jgi:hypothetical protein